MYDIIYDFVVLGWSVRTIIMLLLTQSVTAIFVAFFSVGLVFVIGNIDQEIRRKRIYILLFLCIVMCGFVYYNYDTLLSISHVNDFLEAKEGSVEGHNVSWKIFSNLPSWGYLIGRQSVGGDLTSLILL